MHSFSDIISRWPSCEEFARDVGTKGVNARSMRQRNSIPARFWPKVVESARQRRIEGITHELLSELASMKGVNGT